MIEIKTGGVWEEIIDCQVKVGGAWKNVEVIEVKDGGTWKEAWVALTVTADNVSTNNNGGTPCSSVVGSGTNTTPIGGTGPYTYLWEKQTTADGNAFSISSATAQNPSWSATRCDVDVDNTETWKVTVTDANGYTAETTISVTLRWTDTT